MSTINRPAPKVLTKTGKTIKHGKATTYIGHGCRCEECTKAHTQQHKVFSHKAKLKEPPKHGTASIYNYYGCRCEECTKAHTQHQKVISHKAKLKEPPKHGTASIYKYYGCRCDACRHAMSVVKAAIYARRIKNKVLNSEHSHARTD